VTNATIGVEARTLLGQPTGVGRYLRHLLKEMLALDPTIRFRLYFDRDGDDGLGADPRIERRRVRGRGMNALRWTHAALPRLMRSDPPPLAHFPFYTLPWSPPCPAVVTIHDITFTLRPEWFPWRSRVAFGLFARRSARRAAHVLTVSETSRRDLIGAYALDPAKVTAVPLAAGEEFAPRPPAESEAAARRHGLERPYLVHLGSLHPRRNLERLLDAVAGQPIALALVGRVERPYASVEPMIRARGLEGKVKHLGYVPEGDLPALLGGALALVYPSLYEGFGLPVLEAMACGTPVLTSNVSALPETAGEAAILVDPSSTEEIARGIRDLIGSAELRDRLRAAGLARARSFSWRRTAEGTLAVYARVLGRRP
jgi:glycosyltransferase involved in cell wall biosynthesis